MSLVLLKKFLKSVLPTESVVSMESVIPAEAGISPHQSEIPAPCFRRDMFLGNDGFFKMKDISGTKGVSRMTVKQVFSIISLVLLIAPFQFVSAQGGPVECLKAGDKGGQCSEALEEVEQACIGQDMASYAMVGQATTQAVSQAQGGSAKIAHQGNAAINGALSAAALKRCAACEIAINHCVDTACSNENCIKNKEVKCKPTEQASKKEVALPPHGDGGKEKMLEGNKCVTTVSSIRKECNNKFRTQLNQACLQAGLSGLQSLTSLLAARALGDCPEGVENCVEQPGNGEADNISPPPDPNMPTLGQAPEFGLNEPWGDQNANSNQEAVLPPEEGNGEKKIAGDTKKKGANKEGAKQAGANSDDSLNPLGALGGGGSNSKGVGSQAFNYGKRPSGLGGADFMAGNKKEGEEELEDEEELYPRSLSSGGGFGSGSGGPGGYAQDSSSANGGYGGKGSGLAGDRKVAVNDKKTDTFGKGKSGDTIFTQMSRFIKKVCHGNAKCR